MAIVLHLLPAPAWDELAPGAPVVNESLATAGFVHCTDDADVLLAVANRVYRQLPGQFVVLHVDTELLTVPCLWEEPDGPALAPSFPHVYGPIDRGAVVAWQRVRRDGSGTFTGYGVINT